jgi:hypothetical protein
MIYLGDMDQDGWGEYLIVGIESGYYHQLNIYESVGDNKFIKTWEARYTESPWASATLGRGDYDGDGRDEFFFNNGHIKTRFFRAAGDNNYEVFHEKDTGPTTYGFDLNQDGQWAIMHGYGFDTPANLRLKIYRYGIVSSAEEEGFSDNAYTELRAYPNPFNSSQTITYHLNQEGNIKIAIYNLLGEEVRKLKNDFSPKGEYRIHWDGKNNKGGDLSTGIYIISLVSNSSRQSIKILYIK